MKKLFKLLSLFRLVKELRGHRHHGHGGYGYHRSRSHFPLHHRHGYRRSLAERVIGRLIHGRRRYY